MVNTPDDHAVDLIVGAFFFAMRSCEYVHTPTPGRTKIARLRCLIFRDRNRKTLPHNHPSLLRRSKFITVVFEDQKNGETMDRRTQRKTGHHFLCPVLRFGRAVQRVLAHVPDASPDTPVCTIHSPLHNGKYINNKYTLNLIRSTCKLFGGKEKFGFDPLEIGNKSLRSGAAMALFLKNHSTAKIMILGRWSSDAFLAYIRPQVLEWTNNMSKDMISFKDFLDIGFYDKSSPSDPRLRKRLQPKNGNSSNFILPQFNIHF